MTYLRYLRLFEYLIIFQNSNVLHGFLEYYTGSITIY